MEQQHTALFSDTKIKSSLDFLNKRIIQYMFHWGAIYKMVNIMSENIETNKLFVGNLHWHVRRQELKEYFAQWGEVEFATVAFDRESKRSRGFGFVTFVNTADAAKAKEESNEQELNGRPIYVDFARARDDEEEGTPEEENVEIEEVTEVETKAEETPDTEETEDQE